jgi:hypothetical protein
LQFELKVGFKEEVVGLREIHRVEQEKCAFEAANDYELFEKSLGFSFRFVGEFLLEYAIVVTDILNKIKQEYNFLNILIEHKGIVNDAIQLLIVLLPLFK